MSGQRLCDLYDDPDAFEILLSDAESKAETDWEVSFVSGIRDKFDQWGEDMFLTDLQNDHLGRIARKD